MNNDHTTTRSTPAHDPTDTLDPEVRDTLTTRRDALVKSGRWGLSMALASVPVGLGVLAKSAYAAQGIPQQVVDILNFALTLEYLEAEFYQTGVVDNPGLIPADDLPIFDQIRLHENAHVALLASALGTAAVAKPTFDFTAGGSFDPFNDYPTFLILAQGFEDTGVRAYKGGAAGLLQSPDFLDTALRIHSVEARHASEVRAVRARSRWIESDDTNAPPIAAVYAGEDNTTHGGVDVTTVSNIGEVQITEAWDEPMGMDDVNAIAGMFIVS